MTATERAMKPVLRAALEESGRSRREVAAILGVPYQRIADGLNDNEPQDLFPGLKLFIRFVRATTLAPLRAVNAELGCATVELPQIAVANDELFSEGARITEQLGEAFTVLRDVMADHAVDDAELARAIPRFDDVIDAALRFRAVAVQHLQRCRDMKPAPARMTLPAPAAIERRA